MEMTNLTELSEIDILQLQFNILEELKIKRNQEDIEINNDVSFNRYPVGRGKVERSIHRDEIEGMLHKGYSSRTISKYLQDRYNENISHVAINTHKQNHLLSKKELWGDNTQKTIERKSKEYAKFRRDVLERDRVCQCCGSSEELEVHHALPFSQYNSIGADTNNGIVLCKECHSRYHSEYGTKRNANAVTLAQFLRDYAKPFQSNLQPPSPDNPPIYLLDDLEKMDHIVRNAHQNIRSFEKEHGGLCPKEMIMSELKKELSEDEAEFLIKKLLQRGLIYSPKPEHYKTLSYEVQHV